MTHEAAAVFAQVIPVLIIATYLGNIGLHRAPRLIRQLLSYNVALAGFVEFGLLYSMVGSGPIPRSVTGAALFSAGCLLLMLVFIAAVRLGADFETGNASNDNGSKEK